MASPEHSKLDVLVGTWRTEGLMWATPDADPTEFTAEDRYEWLAGRHFLLHHVDAKLGAEHVVALEIFRSTGEGTYVAESYDNRGEHVVAEAILSGNDLRITSDTERFSGTLALDGRSMRGTWERREDDEWLRWMDVSLTKQ